MTTHTAAIEELRTAVITAKRSLIGLRKTESALFVARQQAVDASERAHSMVLLQMRLIERLVASIEALESLDEPVDGDGA